MEPDQLALRQRCTRFLTGDGLVRPVEQLAWIPADVSPDIYGEGGVVADLEAHVSALLAKPAAVYLPSGTMAQAATLRVHADHRSSRTVIWHPYCHLDTHEDRAFSRVHQLLGRPVGDRERLLRHADLDDVAEPVAAVVWELPQRDLGGQLPPWDELLDQVGWAREHGAAAHLDGARLWEAAAGYQRSPAEIATAFDSVYVSFYKGIGALPGCAVAGATDLVDQVREWRHRLGGTLHGLWPGAASALALVDERLAEMPDRLRHARAVAAALADRPGVRVVPNPPQTAMMHLLLGVPTELFAARARALAEDTGMWSWASASPTADPEVCRVELTVGRATCALDPAEIADVVAQLAAPA